MDVRAAFLAGPGQDFVVTTLQLDPPREGEVLVRVLAAGVCHSDWHLVTGDTRHPMPVVAGHEGAGVVVSVGPGVSGLRPDDFVILSWAPACGTCFYCQIGKPNLCTTFVGPIWSGTMLDGTTRLHRNGAPVYHYCGLACFADHAVVPAVSCVPIQGDLQAEVAAVIGCAVTTGVGSVLNTAKVEKGSSVAVFGAGGVGLSTVMGARLATARPIIAIDPLEERRAAALEVGADYAIESDDRTIETVHELTAGRGADYVFEAVGSPRLQELALTAARPGGVVVFSGLAPMGSATNLPGAVLVREEKTVMGSYYGSSNAPIDFVRYVELFRQGHLPLDRLVSHQFTLSEINQAFREMLEGGVRRGVIVMTA